MEVATLIELLREMAPQLAVEDCVHPGLFPNGASVRRLGVCLDPTAGVIANAVQRGIKILIAYHPWHGEADQLVRETEFGIIPLHTAWDNAPEGVNFTFAREIGLVDIQIRQKVVTGVTDMALRDLLERCRRTVEQNIIPYRGELRASVKKIGLWAGPGFLPFNRWVWEECVAQGCDTIISGEISLLPLRYAAAHQLQLIDLGHSMIARPAMRKLAQFLKKRCGPEDKVEFLSDCYGCNYYTNFNYCQSEEAEEDSEEFISLFMRR